MATLKHSYALNSAVLYMFDAQATHSVSKTHRRVTPKYNEAQLSQRDRGTRYVS